MEDKLEKVGKPAQGKWSKRSKEATKRWEDAKNRGDQEMEHDAGMYMDNVGVLAAKEQQKAKETQIAADKKAKARKESNRPKTIQDLKARFSGEKGVAPKKKSVDIIHDKLSAIKELLNKNMNMSYGSDAMGAGADMGMGSAAGVNTAKSEEPKKEKLVLHKNGQWSLTCKAENPDKDADAKLGEEVEHLVEEHMLENKEAEKKEGHKLLQD